MAAMAAAAATRASAGAAAANGEAVKAEQGHDEGRAMEAPPPTPAAAPAAGGQPLASAVPAPAKWWAAPSELKDLREALWHVARVDLALGFGLVTLALTLVAVALRAAPEQKCKSVDALIAPSSRRAAEGVHEYVKDKDFNKVPGIPFLHADLNLDDHLQEPDLEPPPEPCSELSPNGEATPPGAEPEESTPLPQLSGHVAEVGSECMLCVPVECFVSGVEVSEPFDLCNRHGTPAFHMAMHSHGLERTINVSKVPHRTQPLGAVRLQQAPVGSTQACFDVLNHLGEPWGSLLPQPDMGYVLSRCGEDLLVVSTDALGGCFRLCTPTGTEVAKASLATFGGHLGVQHFEIRISPGADPVLVLCCLLSPLLLRTSVGAASPPECSAAC